MTTDCPVCQGRLRFRAEDDECYDVELDCPHCGREVYVEVLRGEVIDAGPTDRPARER